MISSIEQKKNEVVAVAEKFKASQSIVAFKYQGLPVDKFTELRRSLRADGCEVKVIRNNITRRAALECGYEELVDAFTGPVAVIFSESDMVAPAKNIFKFAEANKTVEVIKGVVDGDVYSFEKLEALSKLPSYETLLTQLAAGMLGTVRELAIGLNMLTEKEEA